MVGTRSQLGNLSKEEELIEELVSVEGISSKLCDYTVIQETSYYLCL